MKKPGAQKADDIANRIEGIELALRDILEEFKDLNKMMSILVAIFLAESGIKIESDKEKLDA
jgi:hypothetical protein